MTPSPNANDSFPVLTWGALVVALAATAGSLWLSLGAGLAPCPLCYYERTTAFAAAAILIVGLLCRLERTTSTSLLVLPIAALGAGVAGFHVWLEASGKLECPAGIAGLGSAPQQSLAALSLLVLVSLVDASSACRAGRAQAVGIFAGLVLGGIFAAASVLSVPPPPKPPAQPYPDSPQTCRPPFRADSH